MALTNKELAYLEIYKNSNAEEAVQKIHPEMDSIYAFLYTGSINYRNINIFLSFISDPDSVPYKDVNIRYIEDMIDMIKSIIHASCEYALSNPLRQKYLYRFENENNVPAYERRELNSFKSTSASSSEATVFDYPNTTSFAYEVNTGFIPHVSIDSVIDGGMFSDEKEILFPPFLHIFLTEEYNDTHSGPYRIARIEDHFDDESFINQEELDRLYQDAISKVEHIHNRDQKAGIVSEELSNTTFVIYNYLREYARNMFREYKQKYEQKYQKEEGKQY